jgi:hypothetical protein
MNSKKDSIGYSPIKLPLIFSSISKLPILSPTLAMIYQITNNPDESFFDILGDLLNFQGFQYNDSIRKIKLSYEEALEATQNLNSKLWDDKIKRILYNLSVDYNFMGKVQQFNNCFEAADKVDLDFMINLFKQEAMERQKGNITFIHSRNQKYKLMNSIISLIANQNTKYLPKCKLSKKSVLKSKEKVNQLYKELPDTNKDFKSLRPDNIPMIAERLISVNFSILNNFYAIGESSFWWFLEFGGNMSDFNKVLKRQIKDDKLAKKFEDFFNQIIEYKQKINTNPEFRGQTLLLFSFPEDKVEDYVFPSNYGARVLNINLEDYLEKYLSKDLWKNDFMKMYATQFRIMDICYDVYGRQDGVEIYEFEQNPLDEKILEYTIKKNFTPKELQKLAILSDLPSVIEQFEEWPVDYRFPENEDEMIDILATKLNRITSFQMSKSPKEIEKINSVLNLDIDKINSPPPFPPNKYKDEILTR